MNFIEECSKFTFFNFSSFVLADSVEEGHKIVQTAIEKFGRIGKILLLLLFFLSLVCLHFIFFLNFTFQTFSSTMRAFCATAR